MSTTTTSHFALASPYSPTPVVPYFGDLAVSSVNMTKLSDPLKAFINAAHARPNTTPAPKHIASVYERIAKDAKGKGVGIEGWLTASVRLMKSAYHS